MKISFRIIPMITPIEPNADNPTAAQLRSFFRNKLLNKLNSGPIVNPKPEPIIE